MSVTPSKAARVIKAVQIQEVRLVESTASSAIRSGHDVEGVTLTINYSGGVPSPPEGGVFYVVAPIEALVTLEGSSEPVVSIKARFELKYSIPGDLVPTQEELGAFAEVNGVFNAWPYWREFIQSTISRMNLPPVILPLFRIGDDKKETHPPPHDSETAANAE